MIPDYKISNYDKMKGSMADVFLQYNQEEIISKFSLEYDKKYLYVLFVDRKYRINRETGAVSWSEDLFRTEESAGYNEVMTLYDVFCYSKRNCHPANEWVNISSLSTIQSGTLKKGNNFFQNIGEYFNGKTEELSFACEALHGKRLEKGDVAYKLNLFSFLSIILRFWEADEDFPPTMQILVDKNVVDYMHYETLMFAITHMFDRIKKICADVIN